MLWIALFFSALLGIRQEQLYTKYGKNNNQEALFYVVNIFCFFFRIFYEVFIDLYLDIYILLFLSMFFLYRLSFLWPAIYINTFKFSMIRVSFEKTLKFFRKQIFKRSFVEPTFGVPKLWLYLLLNDIAQ